MTQARRLVRIVVLEHEPSCTKQAALHRCTRTGKEQHHTAPRVYAVCSPRGPLEDGLHARAPCDTIAQCCFPRAKVQVKGLFLSETESLMESLGEKPDRAEVLFSWLYHDGKLIRDVDESAPSNDRDKRDRWRPLGKKTRNKLRAVATADGGLSLEVRERVLVFTPYRGPVCVCVCVPLACPFVRAVLQGCHRW